MNMEEERKKKLNLVDDQLHCRGQEISELCSDVHFNLDLCVNGLHFFCL